MIGFTVSYSLSLKLPTPLKLRPSIGVCQLNSRSIPFVVASPKLVKPLTPLIAPVALVCRFSYPSW
jgi:hypothetical protein